MRNIKGKSPVDVGDNSAVKQGRTGSRFLRRLLLVFAILISLLIIIPAAGIGYLKYRYNDEYIKNSLISAFNSNSNAVLDIGSLTTSWLKQEVAINDIRIIANEDTSQPLISLDSLSGKINLIESINEKALNADVLLDRLDINIQRYKIYDSKTGKEKVTTNIADALNNLIDLPWKKWLSDINWRSAGGSLSLNHSTVNLHDTLNLLKDCNIKDINLNIQRHYNDIQSSISFTSHTRTDLRGDFSLGLQAVLNSPENYTDNPRLNFLKTISVNSQCNDLDVAQYLTYFGFHKLEFDKYSLVVDDPVSMVLDVDSKSMNSVKVSSRITSDSIGTIFILDEPLSITPKLAVELSGELDLASVWTELKPLNATLRLYNDTGVILNASSHLNGNFGDRITATVDANSNLTAFSNTELGKELDSKLSGEVFHTLALNWKRDGVWKINYSMLGKDVSTVIDNTKITTPLATDISCLITESNILMPIKGSMNFSVKLPFLSIESLKSLDFDLSSLRSPLVASVKYTADLAKLYDSFQGIMQKFSIARVDEVAKGELNADTSGNIKLDLRLESKSEEHKGNPLELSCILSTLSHNNYHFDLKVEDNSNISLSAKGDIEKTLKFWKASLTQSGEYTCAILNSLTRRFSNLIGDIRLPRTLNGSIHQAVNANIIYQNPDNIMVAAGANIRINNFEIELNNRKISKPEFSLGTSFVFKENSPGRTIQFKDLKLNTGESFININTGEYDLTSIDKDDWRSSLRMLPEVNCELNIADTEMTDIGAITGNEIADLFFRNGTLNGKFTSDGKSICRIEEVDYHSIPINVKSNKAFMIDPVIMADKIIDQKWFEIQKSLSDVYATVSADLYNWRTFIPKIAVDATSGFEFDAVYYQKDDKLEVKSFNSKPGSRTDTLIPDISFTGSVVDFFVNLEDFDFLKFMLSIDDYLNIKHADISIHKLKSYYDISSGSNIRALQGKTIRLDNVIIDHELDTMVLNARGSITGQTSYLSKSSSWPLLSINGTVSNFKYPFNFDLNDNQIKVRGAIDFTDSEIKFNALNPYLYNKPAKESLKLEFNAGRVNDNISIVNSAELVGGPLGVSLKGMRLNERDNRYSLSLNSVKLDGPLSASITDLLLDSGSDVMKGNVVIDPISLSEIQSNLNLRFPVNLTGTINGIKLHIDDTYWKYFAPLSRDVKVMRTPNNYASVGSTDITVSSASAEDSISFSFSGASADESIDSVVLNNLIIDNPEGFSNKIALEAETVSIQPEFRSIFSDHIIIDRIDVDGLTAYYDVVFTKNNFDELEKIMSNIFSNEKGAGGNVPTRNTLIKDLYINNGVVKLSPSLLLGIASIPVPLNLHLQNIGGDSSGQSVVSGFISIFKTIGKLGLGLVGGVGETVGGAVNGVGKIGKSIITSPIKLFKHIGGNNDKRSED